MNTKKDDLHAAYAQARMEYLRAREKFNAARDALTTAAKRDERSQRMDASSCQFPPPANFTHWSRDHADAKLPHPWCPVEMAPPPARSLGQLAVEWTNGTVPVLPSLLVPCCAHSGTTFLWRCMQYAFHPQRVCGRRVGMRHNPAYATRSEDWSDRACRGRRYLLPGLTGNIEGHWDYRKEWFFYGGGGGGWAKGWGEYKGVDLPLCYWEAEFQRLLRERPLDDTLMHSRQLCRRTMATSASSPSSSSSSSPHSGSGNDRFCIHRACTPLDLDKVRLSPAFAPEYDRRFKPRWQFQATKALPRLDPRVHPGARVSDMTPNYLCSPKALRNLASTVGTPRHFRILVLHRAPIGMINASYKMFIQWGWVRTADLESDVLAQLKALRECNETLYARPELLQSAGAAELLTYFGRCWRGHWREFVANSMPYVCLRAWMAAGFRSEQFMLVRQERLRTVRAPELLTAVSNFTGLTYNRQVLHDKEIELNVHCEAPPSAKARAGATGRSVDGSATDAAANKLPGVKRKRLGTSAERERPLVNSHSSYTGNDAVRRTQLQPSTLVELQRLATAHTRLLEGLGLYELPLPAAEHVASTK
jgi:hypothetical protein